MTKRRLALVLAGVGLVAVIIFGALFAHRLALGDRTCTFKGENATFHVSPEELANARTVASIARERGLPHHAVTIALAAALQESKLRNLSGGDRDSVGLFQQRPSQGWGPRALLLDPAYATTAFYRELVKIDGWQTMPVTEAAQRVQRSSAPTAYEQWEPEARALARILTGEVTTPIACKSPSLL
ncbi:MAG TPA: hypothetical protein VIC35_03245 [Acidimicrobiia bacterium]